MSFVYTLAWWHIPAAITLLALVWLVIPGKPDNSMFPDIGVIFNIIGALIVVLLAWAIAGFCK